ncbi:MAG TPA: hypothetical protein VG737_11515 [Cyclobacteriaceae bacterium]|nr:hypothetical protein [Cyclobacteriaceae bacterium]
MGWISRSMMILFVSCTLTALAQEKEPWEKETGEGEIVDVEIEIVKDRKIVLPRAVRNFEKIPPRPFEPIKPAITYELKNFQFATPSYRPSVRPLKLKQEELSKIYGNYVSGGLGNYGSFYLEGSMTTKRDKDKFLGAHLYTRSFASGPVDDKNSASATTNLQVFGKSTGKVLTATGEANYDVRSGYFYGYVPDGSGVEVNRDRIRQVYTTYGANIGLENTRVSDFNYTLKAGYSYLQDFYHAREGEASFVFNSAYKINDNTKFILDADYFLINRQDSLVSQTRHLFRVKPAYQFNPIDKLVLTAGANIAISSDQYPGSKDFHFYPHVKAQYELSPSFEAYGIVTGDMDKVNLHSISAENMWVASNSISVSNNFFNTNRSLEFKGGINGKVGRKVAVGAGVSVAALKNFYYYGVLGSNANPAHQPLPAFMNSFYLMYDGNTRRINPFAEISYAEAETFKLSVRGDYFKYSTEDLPGPSQRPTYRISATSLYNIFDKISLEAGFIAQGGMKVYGAGSSIALDPAFDLNVKTRYFISKQFSAFVMLNNILGNNYPLYLGYPARGFQVLGGVSWSF